MTPFERAVSTPKGQLKSPYSGLRQRRRGRSQDLPGLTTAMAAMEAVVAEEWRRPSPIRFGFMAMTTTRCSG